MQVYLCIVYAMQGGRYLHQTTKGLVSLKACLLAHYSIASENMNTLGVTEAQVILIERYM